MLLIVIIALLSTSRFYHRAKVANVHPGKVASVPFVAAGIFLVLSIAISFALDRLLTPSLVSEFPARLIALQANIFLALAYLTLINRTWRELERRSVEQSC